MKVPNNSLEFLQTLLESTDQGIIACDAEMNITFSNQRAAEIHGLPKDVPAQLWHEHLRIFEADGITPTPFDKLPLVRLIRGETVEKAYHFVLSPGRQPVLVKYNGKILRNPEGQITGAVITTEDERDLAQSWARFQAIFEQSPLSIQLLNRHGKTILVNRAYRELWSVSEDFVENYILKEYNILEDELLIRAGKIDDIRRAFSGETVQVPEFLYDPMVLGLPGRPRWANGIVYPLKNASGEVQEVVIIHQDQTENQLAKAEREKLLGQLEGILRQMPTGLMVTDANGKISIHNQKIEQIFGDQERALTVVQGAVRKALQGEFLRSTELTYTDLQGKTIALSTSASPIHDPEGSITGAIVMTSDITEEKREEQNKIFLDKVKSILMSTIDYDKILDQITATTIPYLADGCMVDIIEGDKIKRLSTRHHDHRIQSYLFELSELFPPNINSPQPTAKVMRTGDSDLLRDVDSSIISQHTYDIEHARIIEKIGIRSHIAIPLRIRGRIIGAINLFISSDRRHYDEKDLLVAEELASLASVALDNANLFREAKKAIQLREDFISMASHELRTPITSLNLQIEVLNDLAMGLRDDTEIRKLISKYLKSTNNQVNRLSRLVDDMLDISRISTGKLSLNVKQINLYSLMKEVLERFSDQLQTMRIETSFTSTSQEIWVNCDPERIDQVVTNFMTNAIRYGGRKPIELTLHELSERIVFTIKDHGRGIRREDQDRIFNRFERIHSEQDVNGLGLGLYINKQIILEHAGDIRIESELGKGATFIVELPKAEA